MSFTSVASTITYDFGLGVIPVGSAGVVPPDSDNTYWQVGASSFYFAAPGQPVSYYLMRNADRLWGLQENAQGTWNTFTLKLSMFVLDSGDVIWLSSVIYDVSGVATSVITMIYKGVVS